MAAEAVQILYAGDALLGQSLQSCVEASGWYVYVAQTPQEALGVYLGSMPHVVILNALRAEEAAQYVYQHLRSVANTPVIAIDNPANRHVWNEIEDHKLRFVPPIISVNELVALVDCFVEHNPRQF